MAESISYMGGDDFGTTRLKATVVTNTVAYCPPVGAVAASKMHLTTLIVLFLY